LLTFRPSPETFVVEEIAAYEPVGEGEHTFLWVEKRGLTTMDAARRLARLLDVDPRDVGYAGLKDRHALTRQWMSLPRVDPERARQVSEPDLAVLEVAQPAVDELARLRRRARGVVALLEQRDLEPAQGGVARDAGAGDAAADHDDVVGRDSAHRANDTLSPNNSPRRRAKPSPDGSNSGPQRSKDRNHPAGRVPRWGPSGARQIGAHARKRSEDSTGRT